MSDPAITLLQAIRELIRNNDFEHVWMNAPMKPAIELGQLIDLVIAEHYTDKAREAP